MADDVSEDTTSMEEIETRPNGVDSADNGASGGVEGDVDASTVSGEIAGLQSQLNDVSQTYKRLAADFDNYRKRVERDRAEQLARAQSGLIQRLLDVLDDLERVSHHADTNAS